MVSSKFKQCMHSTCNLRQNWKDGHYQSRDTITEEINKQSKNWMISLLTKMQWERSFTNLDFLEKAGTFHSINIFVYYFYFYFFYFRIGLTKTIFYQNKRNYKAKTLWQIYYYEKILQTANCKINYHLGFFISNKRGLIL